MHPQRKQRLYFVIFLIAMSTIAIGLVLFALNNNLNLFYPPQKIANGEAPKNVSIRAGGCVVNGSIKRATDSLKVEFALTDGKVQFPVIYEGLLPDLFAEGEAAVLKGQVNQQGTFEAVQVLAKHDESYMPPEVAEAMQTSGETDHAATCDAIKDSDKYSQLINTAFRVNKYDT